MVTQRTSSSSPWLCTVLCTVLWRTWGEGEVGTHMRREPRAIRRARPSASRACESRGMWPLCGQGKFCRGTPRGASEVGGHVRAARSPVRRGSGTKEQAAALTATALTNSPNQGLGVRNNGGKWGEMEENGGKWREMGVNGGKWGEMEGNGGKWRKMGGNGGKWGEMEENGGKWRKMGGNGGKWGEMEENGGKGGGNGES